MSVSDYEPRGNLLKNLLSSNGMKWKSHTHVLRTAYRDGRVIAALRQRRVHMTRQTVQLDAIDLVRHGVAEMLIPPTNSSSLCGERRHPLGRFMPPRLFVEFFRALVNGRQRYLRDANRERGNITSAQTCSLADVIDRYLRIAGPFHSDAELFLRLNEEQLDDAEEAGRRKDDGRPDPLCKSGTCPGIRSDFADDIVAAVTGDNYKHLQLWEA